MRKRLVVLLLLGSLTGFASSASAQVSTTGPAGLARQMPRIYGPYMANRSRILNQRKHKKLQQNKVRRHRRQLK